MPDFDRVVSEIGDVTDPTMAERLIGPDTLALLHLAAVVSSQAVAVAEIDIGMTVNLDGT